jgi:hypothetical protein
MDYRAYLERAVGREQAGQWFEKYTRKVATATPETTKET